MAGAGGGLAALMRTVAKAAAADIEISSLPDARFGLVEAQLSHGPAQLGGDASRTLLEQGQIQFPVAIEALPFDRWPRRTSTYAGRCTLCYHDPRPTSPHFVVDAQG